jgi:hypothetical protein
MWSHGSMLRCLRKKRVLRLIMGPGYRRPEVSRWFDGVVIGRRSRRDFGKDVSQSDQRSHLGRQYGSGLSPYRCLRIEPHAFVLRTVDGDETRLSAT